VGHQRLFETTVLGATPSRALPCAVPPAFAAAERVLLVEIERPFPTST
jgi:hypothetical protein